jgi:hypothetical protein
MSSPCGSVAGDGGNGGAVSRGAGDDVSEVPDGGGCVDGARLSTTSSRAWSVLSGTSSSRAERWPEGGCAHRCASVSMPSSTRCEV